MSSIDVRLDPEKIVIGDLPTILQLSRGKVTDEQLIELIEFADRIVVGGVKHYPVVQMHNVFKQIVEQIGEVINPKLASGAPEAEASIGESSST